jgi:hypothetical protein
VAQMCRQLNVSRTGYCQWRKREPSERCLANAALDARWLRFIRKAGAVMVVPASCVVCAIGDYKSAMNEFEIA